MLNKRFAIIGAGNMGRILLTQFCAAGVPADHLVICDSDAARMQAVSGEFGVRTAALEDANFCSADVLIIAASPKSVLGIAQTIAPHLKPGQIVISLAAANPIEWFESMLPAGVSVIRIMPNAPSLIGKGMNPVAYGTTVSNEARAVTTWILGLLGDTLEIRDDQMTWGVGIAGSAMRGLIPVLEGMTQAGIEAGLSPANARRIAAKVMLGTAALVLETDLPFEQLKSLTPMQTVDEGVVTQLFYSAEQAAKQKVDGIQLQFGAALGK
jgi:pyrroline-5-carboxylate reductase